MSTQRRENRWRRTSCTMRSEAVGSFSPRPVAQYARSIASGGTAPPGFPARVATISLQSGYRIVKLVQFVLIVRREVRLGSPPFRAGLGPVTGTPATHGSPPPHIPSPSGLARLHPVLPRVPAG